MNKQQAMTLAYWVMIIVVILTCIFVVYWLQTDARQCLGDPLSYYQNNTNAQCFCMANSIFPQ